MKRIEYEKQTVEKMILLYCRHNQCRHQCGYQDSHQKKSNDELCVECSQLLEYARMRLDHCKFGEKKPSCRKCPIHCYKPDMKQRMREVMRWSGPRMMLYHPIDALRHLIRELSS